MNMQEKIEKIKSILPQSEVFPKYIWDMLFGQLETMQENQLDLLIKILDEECERLSKIK